MCVNYHLGRLSPDERIEFEAKSLMERSIWIQNTLPLFMEKLSYTDKTLSIYVELYKFSILVIQCWESQRLGHYDMYMNSIKEKLPYLFAFNICNYQQSALELLADISLLGDYYIDILRSGIMFETLAMQPGKQVSCGYILEIFNKIIKQITPNLDSTGSAWLRNLDVVPVARLEYIRALKFSRLESFRALNSYCQVGGF